MPRTAIIPDEQISLPISRVSAWGLKFYYLLARKIVEATVQVQLYLKHACMGNENMERVEKRRDNLF